MARKFIPIPIGRMAKAGDIARLPMDVSEQLHNVFNRPGPKIEKRLPWKSDVSGGTLSGYGFMKWRDRTNNAERLVVEASDITIKNVANETWSAAIVGGSPPRNELSTLAMFSSLVPW